MLQHCLHFKNVFTTLTFKTITITISILYYFVFILFFLLYFVVYFVLDFILYFIEFFYIFSIKLVQSYILHTYFLYLFYHIFSTFLKPIESYTICSY